jgi:dTDP-4-dehydrorhamnose reductase
VTFSSDQVFDGQKGGYSESDAPTPVNAFGRSKAEAEQRVLRATDQALIVRSAAFFSPHQRSGFVAKLLASLNAGEPFQASLEAVSPTYLPDLAHAVLDLLIDRERGIWHIANDGCLSWAEFGRRVAQAGGLPSDLIHEFTPDVAVTEHGRARDTSLQSNRGTLLEGTNGAIERFAAELNALENRSFGRDGAIGFAA